MKSMKKIFALVLALVMVLGLAVTASAEGETEGETKITVNDSASHSYAVYQIFTGTANGNKLDDVKLGSNGKLPEGTTNLGQALAALEAKKDAADTEALAVILNYVDLDSTPFGKVSGGNSLDVVPGYYLLKDEGVNADGESYSLYLVEVVDGCTTLKPKRGTVTSEKKVDDVNDSNPNDKATNGKYQDSADHDIGDDVPFTLKATLPENYADFTAYKLVFHDKASAGLTFNDKSVNVYLNTAEEANLIPADKYSLVTKPTDGCTFEVVFGDLMTAVPKAEAKDSIIVKFTAELNTNAVIGPGGNPNEMYLEFSNNPNNVAETGKTPKDRVVVFTYQVIVNKVDENGDPLKGATFALYKKYIDNEGKVNWVQVGENIVGTDATTFTWTGVDDGDYKLVEVQAPAGYNKIADIEFTIEAEHEPKSDNPQLHWLDDDDDNGKKDVFTPGSTKSTLAKTYNDPDGTLTADIQNNPGAVLPETGGVGTTIFYIIGGLLVAAAVVLLVTKKRMASAE